MDKRIVYKNDDGSCGIIVPAPNWKQALAKFLKLEKAEDVEKLTLEDLAEKDVPEGKKWRIVDVDKIPSDRRYRAAWTDSFNTDTVDVDEGKAEVFLSLLREERDKMLEEADILMSKALDSGDSNKVVEVANYRQALRDITETYASPEEVVWPDKPEV